MPIFLNGKEVEATFRTAAGIVEVLAEVRIVGRRLELHDPLVFPYDGSRLDVGIREMLGIAHEVMELARLEGFESVVINGHRTSGATPGRPSVIRRRLQP